MMRYATASFLLLSIVASGTVIGSICAEEPRTDQGQEEDRAAEALELTREVARSIHFFGGPDRTTELMLVESPLLRFSNPVVGEFYAHLFIWTNRGRPEVAASIQKWYAPNQALHLELQSLATRPIAAELKQTRVWHPQEPGVSFAVIPESPVPALLLLIEARQRNGRAAWHYAFAPMNSFAFHVFHRDHEVWEKPQLAPPWPNVFDPAKSYLLIPNFDTKILKGDETP